MACVNHPDRESVARCMDCGDELCGECRIEIGTKSYCAKHAPQHSAEEGMTAGASTSRGTSGASTSQGASGAEVASSTGLDANVAGLLCYVLGWISGLIFLIIENKSDFVKFHAYQSLLTFAGLAVVNILFSLVRILPGMSFAPVSMLLGLAGVLVGVAALIAWIIGMVQAYQGVRYKFPIVGDMAEKYAAGK